MPDEHPLRDRGRALEEEYFRKKDRELLDRMRQASAAESDRRELSEKSGLHDPQMLEELQALGFTPETVVLLPLVPLVQMAWVEGGVSDTERKLILQLARTRGIEEGSSADRQLAGWLSSRPDPQVFSNALRLIRATLDSSPVGDAPLTADDIVNYSQQIAAASGGMFVIKRVSPEERSLLSTIAHGLARDAR
jgi:hypothetical protein